MRLVDGFATFKPIVINLKVNIRAGSDAKSTIEFRASPQPDAHGVWSDLQVAIDDINTEQRSQRLRALARFPPHGEWRTTLANGVQITRCLDLGTIQARADLHHVQQPSHNRCDFRSLPGCLPPPPAR
ncbi:MAG: hypothetical protein IPI48_18815 [bacterium]|nr:hypothetical protein [bacterium]